MLVQGFDFWLQGSGPKDVEYASDRSIIETRHLSGITATVNNHGLKVCQEDKTISEQRFVTDRSCAYLEGGSP